LNEPRWIYSVRLKRSKDFLLFLFLSELFSQHLVGPALTVLPFAKGPPFLSCGSRIVYPSLVSVSEIMPRPELRQCFAFHLFLRLLFISSRMRLPHLYKIPLITHQPKPPSPFFAPPYGEETTPIVYFPPQVSLPFYILRLSAPRKAPPSRTRWDRCFTFPTTPVTFYISPGCNREFCMSSIIRPSL